MVLHLPRPDKALRLTTAPRYGTIRDLTDRYGEIKAAIPTSRYAADRSNPAKATSASQADSMMAAGVGAAGATEAFNRRSTESYNPPSSPSPDTDGSFDSGGGSFGGGGASDSY